jgi:hypothetical protein
MCLLILTAEGLPVTGHNLAVTRTWLFSTLWQWTEEPAKAMLQEEDDAQGPLLAWRQ